MTLRDRLRSRRGLLAVAVVLFVASPLDDLLLAVILGSLVTVGLAAVAVAAVAVVVWTQTDIIQP